MRPTIREGVKFAIPRVCQSSGLLTIENGGEKCATNYSLINLLSQKATFDLFGFSEMPGTIRADVKLRTRTSTEP